MTTDNKPLHYVSFKLSKLYDLEKKNSPVYRVYGQYEL